VCFFRWRVFFRRWRVFCAQFATAPGRHRRHQPPLDEHACAAGHLGETGSAASGQRGGSDGSGGDTRLDWLREFEPGIDHDNGRADSRPGVVPNVSGRLTTPGALAWWHKHTTKADKFVRGVLARGYELELERGEWPQRHHEDRPLRGDEATLAWTRQAVADMVDSGAVKT